MNQKDELRELELIINKFNPDLYIWVILKFIYRYSYMYSDTLNAKDITLSFIEKCETNDDVKSKLLLLIFDLNIDKKSKIRYLQEILHEKPENNLLKILKIIRENKRLADYFYYNLDNNYNKNRSISKLINDIIISKNEKNQKEPIFTHNESYSELLYFYSNSTPIFINAHLTDRYINKKIYDAPFNNFYYTIKTITKKSNTIIYKNLEKEGFAEWLFNYIEKNIIYSDMTQNTHYSPYNLEERTNFMLHQLDFWYLLDEKRYDKVLKKIQTAWHKRTYDARKRASKL